MFKALNKATGNVKTKFAAMIAALLAATGTTYCSDTFDPNKGAQTMLKFIFQALTLGGIVFIAMGVIQIVKAVSEGESAPPNAIPKALGYLIGGIVMAAAKMIVTKGFGINVDNFQLY